jgi:hypothetical protein
MLIYERDTARTMGFFVGHETIDVETNANYVIFDRLSDGNYRIRVFDKKAKIETDNVLNLEEAYRTYRHYTVFYQMEGHEDIDISAWN